MFFFVISKWSSRIFLEDHKHCFFYLTIMNLSQYGQKKFFTLCFPSIDSQRWVRNSEIHSQLFNTLEQEDYPRRRDKAKNGRWLKHTQWKPWCCQYNTNILQTKKRNNSNHKRKKIMTIKSLPKNTFLSFTECLNSCAYACSVTSWKKREEVKTWNVNIFQKTHLGNKLWVVRERNKCFLPIKHEQLWKSRVLYKACFRTKALPGCYALRALVSVQNINTNKLTWTQHSDIAFFSLMHAPN